METASDRRLRKLKWVVKTFGGLESVASAAQLNPATLDQILKGTLLPAKKDGSRSPRGLGAPAARAIEDALSLGRGWFDSPDQAEAQGSGAPADERTSITVDRQLLEVVLFQCISRGSPLTPAGADMLREAFAQVGLGRDAADLLIKYTGLMMRPPAPAPAADPPTPSQPAQRRAKAT